MVAEARLAARLGWIGPDAVDRLIRLLDRLGLPTSAPGLDPDRLVEAMGRDKKNRERQDPLRPAALDRPRRADRRRRRGRRPGRARGPL